MERRGIAPHETFELHELLTFKNVCATKALTMANMVEDTQLKSMLQKDFSTSQGHIRELQNLIQQSDFAALTSSRVSPSGTASVQ